MRRRKPAPHGFAVNGNLNKIKRLILMCRICSPPPGNLGNHAGRLAVDKPFTGSPKVLLITTQGRPTHLTCGQNDSAYHNPPPKVIAKRATTPSFRSKCIARNQEQQPPSHKREAARVRLVMALFPKFVYNKLLVARSGRNVPAWLVFDFQATRRTFLFPRSPYSPGKRPESFRL